MPSTSSTSKTSTGKSISLGGLVSLGKSLGGGSSWSSSSSSSSKYVCPPQPLKGSVTYVPSVCTTTYHSDSKSSSSSGSSGSSSYSSTPTTQSKLEPFNFKVECTGLKPNTLHLFYFEGKDLSFRCVSTNNPQYAGLLKSDDEGSLSFTYSDSIVSTTIGSGNVTGISASNIKAGDKKFELKEYTTSNSIPVTSSASAIVPFRN